MLKAIALLKQGQRRGLQSIGASERERVRERWGHGEGGPDEPTTPVAELEGRLACLELSHPVSGSSPMPAQPATPAQLKLPRLLFRAQPMHVLPTAD